MSTLDMPRLKEIMRATADEDTDVDWEGDLLDQPFTDMGFDSLAVLEIATSIQQRFGLVMPDEVVAELTTPRSVIDYVNAHRPATA
ncbi:acyl carrier protein [Streptomonospora nanhaiensis]|uniref:Act minimal PKS acyl carrier protein n=1 Tax=Streptomonospora nanhaiensis TaxID=1323731 RepID=A0A853BH82_9ACTN|nr:acyl carrier protein [Streptomonospora nanhaiensis]MBV2365260.1 acyl carrier protein [Streptomonospora nanhaiensis]MBX9390303.1 acyl carrier protein [Streptomonospora nanhaiensis]NYI94739.1 act minimal PKS acyl carrier protein [Streptomonospora nanhaiensis]